MRTRCAVIAALLAAASAAAPAPARAEDVADDDPFDLDWSYLYDGGVVPFVYGSSAVAAAVFVAAAPPSTPRLFAPAEGGEPRVDQSIPDAAVFGFGALAGLGVASFDREARWFHTKGFVESYLTTAAATELTKNVFGRHRPRFDEAISEGEDDSKSFYSGHASLTLTSVTYVGLYLRRHGFAPWRGERALAWWEVPAYLSLAAVAVYVPYTRVNENYHHLSDVLVGAAVGTGTAAAFFWWQERRYQRATVGLQRRDAPRAMVVPLGGAGLQIVGSF